MSEASSPPLSSIPDSDAIAKASSWVQPLRQEIGRVLVGQADLVDRLLVALLTNGHVLLEGVPGLAKTLAVRTLSSCLQAKFQRIQFTPDLLPADVVGTMVYHPRDGTFSPRLGPVFANLILA
ncbi:MAG: ATPase associated with various cellular 3, partial [Verrucomicrobiaceae bacterium]|nr:ATPase associated with various cellular 3 [Verrucomicrobiaceae bacterium]